MKKTRLFFMAFSMLMLLFAACSKDDDSSGSDPQQNPPTFNSEVVTPPDAMVQSNDPGAQQAVQYINMANTYANMGSAFMTPPQKCTTYKSTNGDGPPWVYSWEVNEGEDHYKVTLTIDENDEEYFWNVVVDGTMGGEVYDNFVFMEATQARDGSAGTFTLYDPEEGTAIVTMNWTKDEAGVFNLNLNMFDSTKLLITVNPDGSGVLELYDWNETEWELSYKAQWDNAGHGEWWQYLDGEVINHGLW